MPKTFVAPKRRSDDRGIPGRSLTTPLPSRKSIAWLNPLFARTVAALALLRFAELGLAPLRSNG